MQNLISISKAAEFLNVSIDTVRRWDKLGILHSTRPGGKIRYFDLEELKRVKSSKPLIRGISLQQNSTKVGLLLVRIIIIAVTILTILFLLFPERMARLLTSFM